LSHGLGKLPQRVEAAFEAKTLQGHFVFGGRLGNGASDEVVADQAQVADGGLKLV
jgi:hypothetical protein